MRKQVINLLSQKLNHEELDLVPKSFDIVGDIALMRVPDVIRHRRLIIAKAIMEVNNHIKTVLCQITPTRGTFRLRKLEHVLGEEKTVTIHREFSCAFQVDLSKVYFSPRLSYERMRIARLVKPGEIVVNMFAGVGTFSIIQAKHSEVKKVYSIDVNPEAIALLNKNIWLNRVEDKVEAMLGDARSIIDNELTNVADRVLMPLPEKAYEYLDVAFKALRLTGGTIHYYDFMNANKIESPIQKTVDKIVSRLKELRILNEITFSRIVRSIGPRWYQTVLDIKIKS